MAEKKGAPAWMVSFGDMMTLILTFFILLVSLSKEQNDGLVAEGIGSFVVALRSFGLPGSLSGDEQESIFDEVRKRFLLPEEENPKRRAEHLDAADKEQIRAVAASALQPHDELNQPAVAIFDEGSAELTKSSRRFLDLLAATLRPGIGQTLQIEGHASDSADSGPSSRWLAFARAKAVADYLIDEHDYKRSRVETRAWLKEITASGVPTRSVDARLIMPTTQED